MVGEGRLRDRDRTYIKGEVCTKGGLLGCFFYQEFLAWGKGVVQDWVGLAWV